MVCWLRYHYIRNKIGQKTMKSESGNKSRAPWSGELHISEMLLADNFWTFDTHRQPFWKSLIPLSPVFHTGAIKLTGVQPDTITYHYDDVTWTSCSLKIIGHSNVCFTAYSDQHQRNIKVRITGPLCGEFTGDRWPVNSPHKRPVTRKTFIWWRHHAVFTSHVVTTYPRQHNISIKLNLKTYRQDANFSVCRIEESPAIYPNIHQRWGWPLHPLANGKIVKALCSG